MKTIENQLCMDRNILKTMDFGKCSMVILTFWKGYQGHNLPYAVLEVDETTNLENMLAAEGDADVA